jgi:hypothetical protein
VRGWRLGALVRVRSAGARAAAFHGVRADARAREREEAAAEAGRRVLDLRRQAGAGRQDPPVSPRGPGAMPIQEIATTAALRARIDGESRRLAAESARIGALAVESRARARQAIAHASAARGVADAIERGQARWRAGVRSAREAEREREVEESWMASRTARAPTRGA